MSEIADKSIPTAGRTYRVEEQDTDCCCTGCAGGDEFNLKNHLFFIISAATLAGLGMIIQETLRQTPLGLGEYVVFIAAYLLSGWRVLFTALRNLIRGKLFDENSLMSIATIGAIAIQQLPEAVGVMLFFRVGELFQDLSASRSRRSVRALLDIRPEYARLQVGSEMRQVKPEDVNVGDTIIVQPGEKIPLDGDVLLGSTLVDTATLTGEPVPRNVCAGEKVLAGMINLTGLLTIKVTRRFSESSVARIMELVENAGDRKAPTERFITTFARYYTPMIVVAAAIVAFIPPLVVPGAALSTWIYQALVLLVISCPCALVISIPLAYFGGIGGASRKGILVKGAEYLDTLTKVKTAVFDKTGTLTKGNFEVIEVVPRNGVSRKTLLHLAAAVETHSNHPIALSIREADGENSHSPAVRDYSELPGYGVRAVVGGRTVMAGNDRLLRRYGVKYTVEEKDGTIVHLVIDNGYAGFIVIADELKEDAREAIRALKEVGVEKVVMLTGDGQAVAASVADKLGIDSYLAGLLPEDKVQAIEAMEKESRDGAKIAVVGDGINDAPVLARADVGVAMGGLGADAAIETADVVILKDSPLKLAEAIQIARTTRRIVWQNIILALGIKGVFITMGVVGLATMWEAVFADIGVALLAIFNAARAMR